MEKTKYKEIVNRHTPKEDKLKNLFIAFTVGGLVGVSGQLLIDFYSKCVGVSLKEAPAFMIITLIFIGSLLTAIGVFDKLVCFAKAGLIIPITGFAHSMTSASLEYKKEGLVTGIGTNMFKLAGSVILYGVVSAYILGLIRILFGGTG